MSEFKFACPVCGQHITADASASGGQLECPTCFRKIIVPSAPATRDSKLLVSAAQVASPRPIPAEMAAAADPLPTPPRRRALPALGALFLLLAAAGAAWFFLRRPAPQPVPPAPPVAPHPPAPDHPVILNTNYPVPTHIQWTLALANAAFPTTPAAGRIHGSGFRCERAILRKDLLSLSQGKTWPWDLGVNLNLHVRRVEELSGRSIEITPDRPRAPHILLRWKDAQQQPATETIANGYALKLEFGPMADGRIPGKIYLCLPDDAQSFVAGTFDAEIRAPPPPPSRPPGQPKS